METRGHDAGVTAALTAARDRLAAVMPPQADKILRALQQVELAAQHREAQSQPATVLRSLREALRALNQIEDRRRLPSPISTAISTAIDSLVYCLRTFEVETADSVVGHGSDGVYRGPDRRRGLVHDAPCRRCDDDTINLFAPDFRQNGQAG